MEGILGQIFPAARDIPSDITAPNFIPNVEELAATNPDLVIQWVRTNITEAMLASGFNTKSNFNREFLRVMKSSPTAWMGKAAKG